MNPASRQSHRDGILCPRSCSAAPTIDSFDTRRLWLGISFTYGQQRREIRGDRFIGYVSYDLLLFAYEPYLERILEFRDPLYDCLAGCNCDDRQPPSNYVYKRSLDFLPTSSFEQPRRFRSNFCYNEPARRTIRND